jgi:hypothetical protein
MTLGTARRVCHFALTTLVVTGVSARAAARSDAARGEVGLDHRHRGSPWRPMSMHHDTGEAPSGDVEVCVEMPRTPRDRCRASVSVTVALGEAPEAPDFGRRAVTEMNLVHSIERGVAAAAQRRRRAARPVMLYGIEAEPVLQFQLKREMLVLLARLTRQGAIGRAAIGLTPTSSIRSIAESQALERTRDRATFIQIEEFGGANPLATPRTTQAAFAALGASLFWGGFAGEKLLHGALGEAFVIHPQPWPPGIEIKGSFELP